MIHKRKIPQFLFMCWQNGVYLYQISLQCDHNTFFSPEKNCISHFLHIFCFDLNLLTTRLQNILRGRRNLYCPNNKNPNLKWFPHIFPPRNIRVCHIAKSLVCNTWFLPLIPILTINVSPSDPPTTSGAMRTILRSYCCENSELHYFYNFESLS